MTPSSRIPVSMSSDCCSSSAGMSAGADGRFDISTILPRKLSMTFRTIGWRIAWSSVVRLGPAARPTSSGVPSPRGCGAGDDAVFASSRLALSRPTRSPAWLLPAPAKPLAVSGCLLCDDPPLSLPDRISGCGTTFFFHPCCPTAPVGATRRADSGVARSVTGESTPRLPVHAKSPMHCGPNDTHVPEP